MKSQGSAASDPETLQSQTRPSAQKRLSLNGLEIAHGRLAKTALRHRLVVNVDCDIYSATLFVLGTLDKFFVPGSIIIFDDFYSMNDEFKAFVDYDRSFGRTWKRHK